MELFVYNPEHDLAMANNDENYVPPKEALRFAIENEMLPAKYAPAGSLILCHDNRVVDFDGQPVDADVSQLVPVPWGWDKAIVKRLRGIGMTDGQLPTDTYLETIRDLSHRRTAVAAMASLKNRLSFVEAEAPTEVKTADELDCFMHSHDGKAMLKAPWSGRGQGLFWTENGLSSKQKDRSARIIARQGSVMAEPLYDVIQDFAMEYFCRNGEAVFLGYSLFSTRNCAYINNVELDDEAIVRHLTQYIPASWLEDVRREVAVFISENIAQVYDGPVGVDMFIYSDNGRMLLNPMVEINIRFTMGMVNLWKGSGTLIMHN